MSEPFEIPTRVDRVLGDPVVWDEPPPRLRSQLLATAAVERRRRDRIEPAPEPAETTETPSDQVGPRRRRIHRTLAVAAVVAASVVGVGAILRAASDDDGVRLALASPAATSEARGVAEVRPFPSGMEVRLRIDDLAPAAPGTYYAAWLRGDGGVVPLGSFHARDGGPNDEIVLWSAVPLREHPTLMVTRQRIGDPPVPTDDVVLTSAIAGP